MSEPPKQFLSELKRIADLPAIDHIDQIKRWNEYWLMLNRLEKKVNPIPGVSLARRVKTNHSKTYPERGSSDDARLIMFMLTFCTIGFGVIIPMSLAPALTEPFTWGWYSLLATAAGFSGLLLYYHLPRLIHPRTLKMSMKPRLHIDEMALARVEIHGFPQKIKKDPVVNLPKIELKIKRKDLSTYAIQKVMGAMEDIDLPKKFTEMD